MKQKLIHKIFWIDIPGLYARVAFCSSQQALQKEVFKFLRNETDSVVDWSKYEAVTFTMSNSVNKHTVCLVAFKDTFWYRPVFEVDQLLVHEAMHVCQSAFDGINEDNPGSEVEAHLLQYVFTHLKSKYHIVKDRLMKIKNTEVKDLPKKRR